MSEVDIIIHFIFFPSHIKLTNNKPNKDFESVKRPYEVEKFKLDRKIFSSWKKEVVRGIRTHDLTRLSLKSYPLDHKSLLEGIHGV